MARGDMRKPLRKPLFVGLGLALALVVAATAPARADDTSAAREHYQKGTSYYDLGRWTDAIKEFEAAYEIKNDPALLYNLAQSYRQAGNSEQALHFYRTYLRRVPKAPNRAEIEGRITQLEQLVAQKNATQTTPPNVTIPPGGTTTPDQQTSPPPPPPPNNPTTNNPTTTTPPPETTPPLPTGTDTTPTTTPFVTTAPAPSGKGRVLKTAGLITMIGGGAFVIIGFIEGGRAVGAANQINDAAKNGGSFDPAVESRGKSAQAAEAALFTLGVLAAGTGAVLYFYGRKEEQAALSVMPVASANSLGASMRVTF